MKGMVFCIRIDFYLLSFKHNSEADAKNWFTLAILMQCCDLFDIVCPKCYKLNQGGHGASSCDCHPPSFHDTRSNSLEVDNMLREQPSSSSSGPNASGLSEGYIEHRVSKLDTLAGVAIKYGVEVADVKRMNCLVTDLQMFAHNTLKIPLPGRHPPSTILPNSECPGTSGSPLILKRHVPSLNSQVASTVNPESRYNRDKRPLSSAMSLLRGYYGLSSPAQQNLGGMEGMEMTLYRSDSDDHSEDEPFSPITKSGITREDEHRGLANGNQTTKAGDFKKAKDFSRLGSDYIPRVEVVQKIVTGDVDKASERSVRRRSGMNSTMGSYEVEIRQDVGVLDRVQPTSVLSSSTDGSGGGRIGILKVLDGTLVGGKNKEVLTSKVIKSSSTSNLQEQTVLQVNSGCPKYGTKVDLKAANQANLNQAGSRPLFEGLSKPGHRFKAALD